MRQAGLALLALAATAAAPADKAPATHPLLWRCAADLSPVAGIGMLDVTRTFDASGAVVDRSVRFYAESSDAIPRRGAGDTAGEAIDWPSWRSQMQGRPFDWRDGILQVLYYPQNVNIYARERRERWRQALVDRDGSFSESADGQKRYLMVPPGALVLSSEISDSTAPLELPLDQLFAWGSGRDTLRVYETAVELTRARGYGPVRRRRIVVDYTINLERLRADIAAIRHATEVWEASLGDWRTRCPSGPADSPDDIVVT